jgi:hypothetical protein
MQNNEKKEESDKQAIERQRDDKKTAVTNMRVVAENDA